MLAFLIKDDKEVSLHNIIRNGFFAVVFAIVVTFFITYQSFSNVSSLLVSFSQRVQPIVTESNNVAAALQHTTSQLGFYLINPSALAQENLLIRHQKFLADYEVLKKRLHSAASRKTLARANISINLLSLTEQVEHLTVQIEATISTTNNLDSNYPARAYYTKEMEPLVTKINHNLNDLNGLVADLMEEQSSYDKVAINLYRQGRMFGLIHTNTLAFLAQRSKSSISNIKLFQSGLTEQIEFFNQNFSNVDQDIVDGVNELASLSIQYQAHLEPLIKLHLANNWRRDAYLLSTFIEPDVFAIEQQLLDIASRLNVALVHGAKGLKEQITNTLITLLMVLILTIVICSLLTRVVLFHLNELVGNIKDGFALLMTSGDPPTVKKTIIKENNQLRSSFDECINMFDFSALKSLRHRHHVPDTAAEKARQSGLDLIKKTKELS